MDTLHPHDPLQFLSQPCTGYSAPTNKLDSLSWLLCALRNFRRFTLHYISWSYRLMKLDPKISSIQSAHAQQNASIMKRFCFLNYCLLMSSLWFALYRLFPWSLLTFVTVSKFRNPMLWMNEWINGWMNEWTNERMNEWMSEYIRWNWKDLFVKKPSKAFVALTVPVPILDKGGGRR